MSHLGAIDHIDVVVDDPKAMADFLVSIGFALVREMHSRGSIEVAFPGEGDRPILELTPRVQANGDVRELGLRHIAIRSSDIAKTFEELTARGFTFDTPPRLVEETGRMLANLKDPEGRTLQIVDAPRPREQAV